MKTIHKKYHKWKPTLKMRLYSLKIKFHKWIIKKFPFCHGAEGPCFHKGKKRRQNTAYVDDKLNWVFLCGECAYINDKDWQEKWDEYYGVLW